MMFPHTMKQVLLSGGSLDIDLDKNVVFPETMVELAAYAQLGGGHITFRNGVIFPQTAIRVSAAGPGHVTFVK